MALSVCLQTVLQLNKRVNFKKGNNKIKLLKLKEPLRFLPHIMKRKSLEDQGPANY